MFVRANVLMFRKLFRTGIRHFGAAPKPVVSCFSEEPVDLNTKIAHLPNGVKVITEEIHSHLACVSLFVVAGSRYENQYNNGVSYFIEHMAYKGFCSCPKACLEATIQTMGAKLFVKTLRDMQIFSIVLPAHCVAVGIETLYKIVSELELRMDELEWERCKMDEVLVDIDRDPKNVVFDYLHSAAFTGTPLARTVAGTSDTFYNMTRCMILTFLQTNYIPNNLILAVSGGITHDCIVRAACCTFACLPYMENVYRCEPDPGPCRYTSGQMVYRDDSMPYAHVAIAFEAPGYTSPDYTTMLVMESLIGSWHRPQGRCLLQPSSTALSLGCQEIVEHFEAFYIPYRDVGLWGVYFIAERMHLDDVIYAIINNCLEMCVMPTDSVVQRAKLLAKIKVGKRFTGVMNSCRDLGTQMFYTSSRKPLRVLNDNLECCSRDIVLKCASRVFYNKGCVVAGVGPTEAIPNFPRTEAAYWIRY